MKFQITNNKSQISSPATAIDNLTKAGSRHGGDKSQIVNGLVLDICNLFDACNLELGA